jgi:hypothetical protein
MKEFTKELSVELKESDVSLFAQDLAQTANEYNRVEAEKKKVMSCYTEQLKDLRRKITDLADIVESKRALADIPCKWRLTQDGTMKEGIRTDTGEVICIEVATDKDRQESLSV